MGVGKERTLVEKREEGVKREEEQQKRVQRNSVRLCPKEAQVQGTQHAQSKEGRGQRMTSGLGAGMGPGTWGLWGLLEILRIDMFKT